MAEIQEEQIVCDVQCGKQVTIFDADNLGYGAESKKDIENIENIETVQNQKEQMIQTTKQNEELNDKINQELKATSENLFKVLNKKPIGKKLPKINHVATKAERMSGDPNRIMKSGWMQKKTDGLIFKWKRRFFVLTPEKFFFFEDQKKEKVIGCVNMKLISMKVLQNNNQITLDFMGDCENIILRCYTDFDHKQWVEWLNQVSKFQASSNKYLIKTMNKPFYQGADTIIQRQFIEQVETGDILLFYTNHLGAKIQRGITNSQFDHVAMVLKLKKNQVMVFESNQLTGVAIFQWNQFIRCSKLYEKVTVRKLYSARRPQIQHKLLNFIKINLGRKFSLNISKLVTFESDFNWEQVNEDVKRGYFCSQLVAKAYKGAGLLHPVKSSCRYWPVDFSQKSDMKLQRGAHLGPEQVIVLNKHVKKVI